MPHMYEGHCKECGKRYRSTSPNFCSRACYVESHWTERVCQYCGKTFKARKVWVKRGQMKYCSTECSSLASRRFPVIDYDGDRFYYRTTWGYYVSTRTGRRLQRVVWEAENGEIPEKYIIHHKDGDKTNNDPENLELLEWGEHSSLHNRGRIRPKKPKKKCGVDGCDRDMRAKGLCGMHYQRARKEKRGSWN